MKNFAAGIGLALLLGSAIAVAAPDEIVVAGDNQVRKIGFENSDKKNAFFARGENRLQIAGPIDRRAKGLPIMTVGGPIVDLAICHALMAHRFQQDYYAMHGLNGPDSRPGFWVRVNSAVVAGIWATMATITGVTSVMCHLGG